MVALRVVVVDDHPVVRAGLSALLESSGDIEVVAEAASADDAVAAALAHRPEVVVMDLNLPDASGAEATRRIKERAPGVAVLVLTMSEDGDSVRRAISAGATGYVLKGADPVQVVRAVEAVARGELVVGSGVADKVASHIAAAPPAHNSLTASLTEREREVLDLLTDGASNTEIARQLNMQPKTARNHVSNVLTKLGVVDRREAARIAREAQGL
ncbi:MAG TPA: response regulator transcription factor [Acidimicrobiales bacterium]|nr:response regulator transcription factor [Acidimicrobiales bacterium]